MLKSLVGSEMCIRDSISQDRLDAARFDGMTVIVLDRAGYELPVSYLPIMSKDLGKPLLPRKAKALLIPHPHIGRNRLTQ